MGKNKNKKNPNQNQNQTPNKPKSTQNTTLREEKVGKKHADVASILRIKHLTRVATWASGEGRVKPFGSMLGQRLCAAAEASGLPLDSSSVILCQKCETVLQPGFNCTIRVKKNKNINIKCQNNVVYTCHFCYHDNLKWGTAKGTVKNLFASKSGLQVPSKAQSSEYKFRSEERETQNPINPTSNKTASNLFKNEKNEKDDFSSVSVSSSASKSAINASSRKRQRKGWTSLKEKTQNSKRVNNLAFPFEV
ncbi:hypothetical protein LUZ60_001036 [Juncus effusus]|nr:hypothetical protein LUZ60_001036 [Juncus effusus]